MLLTAGVIFATQSHADDDKLKNDAPYYGGSYTPASVSTTPTFTPKVRLTADYGIAYCYGNENNSSSTADDLRTSGNLKLSGEYMATPMLGIGILYSRIASSTTSSGADMDQTVNFVAAAVTARSSTSGAAFVATIGLGRTSYELTATASSTSVSADGTGFGLLASLGGEFYLTPHIAIAIEANTLNSKVKDVKMLGYTLGDIDVSNIGATGGLHVYL
jgi:hypothetical protein